MPRYRVTAVNGCAWTPRTGRVFSRQGKNPAMGSAE